MCSPALEMRRFVDGISMKSADLLAGEYRRRAVWTDFRNGIGAELTREARTTWEERGDTDPSMRPGLSAGL